MGGGLSIYYHLLILLSTSSNQSPSQQSTPSLLPPSFQPPQFSGIILEAPYIALPPSNTPSTITVVVGRLAGKVLPGRQLKSKMKPSFMSRDPLVCKDWDEDPLCHDTTTLEGASGMLDRHGELELLSKGKHHQTRFHPLFSSSSPSTTTSSSPSLPINNHHQTPLLIYHGTEDKATSYSASKSLFTSSSPSPNKSTTSSTLLPFIPSIQFKTYKDAYHVLHADGEGVAQDFRKNVGDWIMEIVKNKNIEMTLKLKSEDMGDGVSSSQIKGGGGEGSKL